MPASGAPRGRSPRRTYVIAAALLAIAVVAAGIFAVAKLSNQPEETAAPEPTGPLNGTFTAEFGPTTDVFGDKPYTGSLSSEPHDGTWSIRSACRASGCVATATRADSQEQESSALVFDDIGGRWVAVNVGSAKCDNAVADLWAVLTLQPRPDGTLSGEYIEVSPRSCATKQTVTFTRTGDVDPSVRVNDPETEPSRVVSPAQGLHGRYHQTTTHSSDGSKEEADFSGRTDCLRDGGRCVSLFGSLDYQQVFVFENGKWTWNAEGDVPCETGGTANVKVAVDYPLPERPQDPITVLTGRGHVDSTGSSCIGDDIDERLVRTGD